MSAYRVTYDRKKKKTFRLVRAVARREVIEATAVVGDKEECDEARMLEVGGKRVQVRRGFLGLEAATSSQGSVSLRLKDGEVQVVAMRSLRKGQSLLIHSSVKKEEEKVWAVGGRANLWRGTHESVARERKREEVQS